MTPEFWRGKRVFLTGHTGFKGSWLALWLSRLGAEVSGYALPAPTAPSLFDLLNLTSRIDDLRGDVRDLGALSSAIKLQRPEIVIHLAAQALVREGYADPVSTYSTNVMGTVNLLEAVRRSESVRVVLNVTSDKCYENREWFWGYRENEPLGGCDPYSGSKACSEMVTNVYRTSYFQHGPAVASARAGNVIGGGDWAADRLIPDIMRAAAAGQSVRLRNPQAIRPWQHVLEPLSGYLSLAESLYQDGAAYSEAWNFGPAVEDSGSVEWIVQELAKHWNKVKWKRDDDAAHPHEAHSLMLDCSKARTRLGWLPLLSLADALEWTVHWYRAYESGGDMPGVTEQQIENYTQLMRVSV
jgi:CDP-glucose 4,6-dehydratase